ncbi:hypothetical protein [Glycomyces sp. NPDC021274]|uniref:hypothetical protein n=1 Tax=Glycomyces sp. NPDC021274 TaxID=3155120 RepID=UPI0033DF71D8
MEEGFSIELEPEVRDWLGDLPRREYDRGEFRRVVLSTVFPKTRSRERFEVDRARRAQFECESRHPHATAVYDRDKEEM